MTILNYVTPSLKISKNIAIIGSSGALKNNTYGKEIDLHDDVVRFNRAPTENFEKFVGSKTTIRVANAHVFSNQSIEKKDWPKHDAKFIKKLKNTKVIYCAPALFDNVWDNRYKKKYIDVTIKSFYLQLNKVKSEQIRYNFHKSDNLTVGVAFIFICFLSNIIPDVYGFDININRKVDHYFSKRPERGGCHNWKNEMVLLKKLSTEGKINLKT